MKKWMIAAAVVGCVMAEVLAVNLSTDKISAETVETITESMQAIDSGDYTSEENQVHWEYDGETLRISGVGEVDDKNFEKKYLKYADEAKTLVIGGGLTGIAEDAFGGSHYYYVETIILEEGIEYIDNYAFSCVNAKSFIMPDTVQEIGICVLQMSSRLQEVQLSKNLVDIGSSAFALTPWYMSLPRNEDGLTILDDILLNACQVSTDYVWGIAKGDVEIPDGIRMIADNAFQECGEMTSVTIPESVELIGNGTFRQCHSLESITIPQKVTKIENGTFMGCKNLKEINLPDSVQSIGNYAFNSCAITKMMLPENLTTIGGFAFEYCANLKNVVYRAKVEHIGAYQFVDCKNLQSITILNPDCEIEEQAQYSNGETLDYLNNVTVYGLPNSTAQAMAEKNGWKFSPLETVVQVSGDANGDGEFSLVDVVQVHKMLLNRKAPPKSCDLNGDNVVNVIDLSLMKRKLLSK